MCRIGKVQSQLKVMLYFYRLSLLRLFRHAVLDTLFCTECHCVIEGPTGPKRYLFVNTLIKCNCEWLKELSLLDHLLHGLFKFIRETTSLPGRKVAGLEDIIPRLLYSINANLLLLSHFTASLLLIIPHPTYAPPPPVPSPTYTVTLL